VSAFLPLDRPPVPVPVPVLVLVLVLEQVLAPVRAQEPVGLARLPSSQPTQRTSP
jgi:hypothetical protein